MSRVKEIVKSWALLTLIVILFFLSFMFSLKNAEKLSQIYPTWSLRYSEQFKENEIKEARRFFAEYEEKGITLSFWTQTGMICEYEGESFSAQATLFDGEAYFADPRSIIDGSYPSEEDTGAVAISNTLSWWLFGGVDTVGMTIKVDGTEKRICGIFDDETESIILKNTNPKTAFENLEFKVLNGAATRENIAMLSTMSSLGTPQNIVDGEGMSTLLFTLAYFPLVLMVVATVVMLIKLIKLGWVRWLVIFGLLLGFAVCVPLILRVFPSWLIPSRWSDFSFWVSLYETLKSHAYSWLSLQPYPRDVYAKIVMIKSVFFSICTVFLSIVTNILVRNKLLK